MADLLIEYLPLIALLVAGYILRPRLRGLGLRPSGFDPTRRDSAFRVEKGRMSEDSAAAGLKSDQSDRKRN